MKNNNQSTRTNYALTADAALHRAHGLRSRAFAETFSALFGRKTR